VALSVTDVLTVATDADTAAAAERGLGRESAEIQTLLDRARAGDQAAFGRLVDLHQRVVLRTAMAALGRAEDAEDAAQEAFVQAWRHLGSFRGRSTFRTWLLTIVWRKALDRRRSRLLRWTRAAEVPVDQDPFAGVAHRGPDPEESAVARDAARRIRREIAALSPTLRDTLLLAASGEYAYDEIAAMLGAPIGTIKWRVSEARRIIASRMTP
jgi:RNA polymerase sigma-70 factor (ECF subfamily)